MTGIRIAADLTLPIDIVTQAIAILARKGAGKTYTAKKLTEEVVRARVPVVVLDPTGAWWGLRSSADGTKAGLPVVIFGGDHGDVPLEATAGTVIADVVLEHPGAYVLDLSAFPSKAAEQRFAADFLERLYRGKRRETGPLLVVVDEADMFAPQRPGPEQTRTLGAIESIVRRGRIKGLGDLLITQRAAVLNKNVLTQTEVLVVMQTTGPQDRAAIDDWIEGNGTAEERAVVIGSLASLERGEAWVWSPSFLRILQRVRIERGTTFDSSRTPEAGEVAIEPKAFAKVDLDALGARIAATREQSKANDPAELRRRITDLERQLRTPAPEVEVRVERVEVPVLNGQVGELREVAMSFDRVAATLTDTSTRLVAVATGILDAIARVESAPRSGPQRPSSSPGRAPTAAVRSEAPQAVAVSPASMSRPQAGGQDGGASSDSLGPTDRAILAALAAYPDGRSQAQVSILSGYRPTSGGFKGSLARLRRDGLIVGGAASLRITDAGLAFGPFPALPSGQMLIDYWIDKLPTAEGNVLRVLIEAGPDGLADEQVSERTGYRLTSGGFKGALAKLRKLDLITGSRSDLRAADDLLAVR